jgi:LacI family transcriptional regulator
MPLTLEDIARLSGFSRSTVSRVINADANVKEETRQKILEVIQSINFQPNLAARGLVTGRTNVIGLVIPAAAATIFTDPYFPQLIQGISTACNAHDYTVMLWLAEPEFERNAIRQILHNGLVDGVIVSSTVMEDPIVNSLYESKMPFILIGRHPVLDVNYVDVDNLQGGIEATQHLLRGGCKRVAVITGPQNQIAGYDRFQGYLKALQERGKAFDPDLVADGEFTESGGYSAMMALIPHKPDGLFAASDMMALGAMRALREAHLRVPEDVAIVGYDDLPEAARTQPPLTTIHQSARALGTTAVETLIDVIAHSEVKMRHIISPTELIVRSSSIVIKPHA